MEKSAQPVDALEFRLAMRKWPTGVTIATVSYQGIQHGMTVSSFTSISLTPPTVLISLERVSRTHDLVVQCGYFGVTILSDRQQPISDRFAGRHTEYEDRFANLKTFSLQTGALFIEGGLAFFDCHVIDILESGTNTLFFGEVLAAQLGEAGSPLVYYDQQYRRLQD
jgi:flavin reductase (DIM6/NTAB) family NADH-FMN oxidoreductase RutF